jgi:hypothetical protein
MSQCVRCGASFEPRRSTARFCSTACRMAAHRGLSVTPATITPKVSVARVSAATAPVSRHVYPAPSTDLTQRAFCPDDRLIFDRMADAPSADNDGALVAARGFYDRGWAAGRAGKTGPFPLMTAADVFFYRGWRAGRRRGAERIAA